MTTDITYTESAESMRDRQMREAEQGQQVLARQRQRPNRAWLNTFTGEVQDFDVPPVRDQGFEMRADHPGHYGSHRGQGTADCPTELHHHHDYRCGSIPPAALRMQVNNAPERSEAFREALGRIREEWDVGLLLPPATMASLAPRPARPRAKKPKTEPSTTVEGTAPLVQRRRARPNG